MEPNCRYNRHAGLISAFYKCDMALRIRQLREQKGWTQEHLAAIANISRSQLAQIESEKRPVNTLRLSAIAAALGVDVAQLFMQSEQDQKILDAARRLSEEDRATVLRMAEALAGQNSAKQE